MANGTGRAERLTEAEAEAVAMLWRNGAASHVRTERAKRRAVAEADAEARLAVANATASGAVGGELVANVWRTRAVRLAVGRADMAARARAHGDLWAAWQTARDRLRGADAATARAVAEFARAVAAEAVARGAEAEDAAARAVAERADQLAERLADG